MPSKDVMHKWKKGKLKKGKGSKPVPKGKKGQKQAEAIMFSEKANEKKHGGKYKHSPKQDRMLKKIQG